MVLSQQCETLFTSAMAVRRDHDRKILGVRHHKKAIVIPHSPRQTNAPFLKMHWVTSTSKSLFTGPRCQNTKTVGRAASNTDAGHIWSTFLECMQEFLKLSHRYNQHPPKIMLSGHVFCH